MGERLIEALASARADDGGELSVGLIDRCAGREPCRCVEAMVAARGHGVIDRERRPQPGGLGKVFGVIGRELEAGRHDADHHHRDAVDADRVIQDAGIAGEAPLPELVAEDRNRRTAFVLFIRGEAAAERRLHAKRGEQVRRHLGGADALRGAITGQAHLPGTPGTSISQRPCRPEVQQLRFRHPRLVPADPAAPDHHGSSGILVRQRLQQDGAGDAEDGRGGTDAQGERQRGDDREAGRSSERPQRVFEVLHAALLSPASLGERIRPAGHLLDEPSVDRVPSAPGWPKAQSLKPKA